MYRIGQVTEITGISRDRLRYYEEKGILKPKYDKSNNYREYDGIRIQDVMRTAFKNSLKWCNENGYNHKGIVFINFVLISFKERNPESYLEIYAPIED